MYRQLKKKLRRWNRYTHQIESSLLPKIIIGEWCRNYELNLKPCPVQFHSSSMSKDLVVRHHVWFCSWISTSAVFSNPSRTPTWWEHARNIALHGKHGWLIQCDPMFNSISKIFETNFRIVLIIIPAQFSRSWLTLSV